MNSETNKRNRKKRIEQLGLSAAFALRATCLGGCCKDSAISPAPVLDSPLPIDLKNAANSNLLQNGGYLIKDRIVIAKTETGEYRVATQRCSQEDESISI